MCYFKNVLLTTLTLTTLIACQTLRSPIQPQRSNSGANLPLLMQLLSKNQALASCPSPVNCGGGGSR